MAGTVLSASEKLMTAASTGNSELVFQLLANSSSSSLEHDEVLPTSSLIMSSLLGFTLLLCSAQSDCLS